MSLSPLYRLAEKDVRPVVEKHLGAWENLETETGAPFEPVPGLTRTALGAQLAAWEDLNGHVSDGGKSELALLYARRDAFFGTSAKDLNGAWYWLGFYKRAATGALDSLPQTPAIVALKGLIPNLGQAKGSAIVGIFNAFVLHWEKVDAALLAGGKTALRIGQNFDLTALQSAQNGWNKAQSDIEQVEGQVPQWRAQRDVILGDFAVDSRAKDSLVQMLYDYHFGVETGFPGSTFAATLPRIFPKQPSDKEPPHFAFNFEALATSVTVWFEVELGSLATLVFLKEGAETQVKPLAEGAGLKIVTFEGIHIEEEIDRLELRAQNNEIVASGKRDANLLKP